MSILVQIKCRKCGEEFSFNPRTYDILGLKEIPKSCPRCVDERQGRPAEAVVINRHCLEVFLAVAIHLPEKLFVLFKARDKDSSCLRAVIKGDTLPGDGVSWDGRLDIYCLATNLPKVARVRVMEVTHVKGHSRIERHGEPLIKKDEVRVDYSPVYQYLVLESTEETPTAALIFPSAHYKTTLKGFGRQYYATVDVSQVLWARELSRRARSGRFGTYGAVAIVDDTHPVISEQTGDVKSKKYFTLSHPNGCDEGMFFAY